MQQLINQKEVLIDECDLDLFQAHPWYINANGYLVATYYGQVQATLIFHREIIKRHNGEIKQGCVVDHIDQNKLNNQRSNLRVTTRRVNKLNSNKSKGIRTTTSGKFQARVGGVNLGSYNTYAEALEVRQRFIELETN